MELKITDDKVREAAKSCPDVDKTLRILFPEAFKQDEKYFIFRPFNIAISDSPYRITIQSRAGGDFNDKGIYLPAILGNTWKLLDRDTDKDLRFSSPGARTLVLEKDK